MGNPFPRVPSSYETEARALPQASMEVTPDTPETAFWISEKGYPQPWDGMSNGKVLPIDSYHYIIDLNNGTKSILGNVTIIK